MVLYIGVGVTLILILRRMSRRWRAQTRAAEDETDVPVRPAEPIPGRRERPTEKEPVG